MTRITLGRRHFTTSVAAGAASLAVPAWAQGEPIKVGVIVPLSGPAGPNGQGVLHAVQVAADLVNAKGGVMGRKLVVVSKDDESTPAVGVTRANEMVAEKVAVVIEGWNSPVTLAMQPVLARADVLDITAVSKADPIPPARPIPTPSASTARTARTARSSPTSCSITSTPSASVS